MALPNSTLFTRLQSSGGDGPAPNGERSSNPSQYPDLGTLFNTYQNFDGNLPRLNEGEFKTDYFRMYEFKVHPCQRTYVHKWSQCPCYHSGENARRRDPRIYQYSPLQCQNFRLMGICDKGDTCEFAHGLFETWLHPGQYRTKVCHDRKRCTRPMCFFAHDHTELRPIYKKTGCGKLGYPIRPPTPASGFQGSPQPFMVPPNALAFPSGLQPFMLHHHAFHNNHHQPFMFPTMLSTRDDQNQTHQYIRNLRILQNSLSAHSNSGLTGYEHSGASTSRLPLVQSPESCATSDNSYFNAGPFFDYDRMQ